MSKRKLLSISFWIHGIHTVLCVLSTILIFINYFFYGIFNNFLFVLGDFCFSFASFTLIPGVIICTVLNIIYLYVSKKDSEDITFSRFYSVAIAMLPVVMILIYFLATFIVIPCGFMVWN